MLADINRQGVSIFRPFGTSGVLGALVHSVVFLFLITNKSQLLARKHSSSIQMINQI